MPGVTASEVERFFHLSRAERAKPPDARQQRLNDIFAQRAADMMIEQIAERWAWERSQE